MKSNRTLFKVGKIFAAGLKLRTYSTVQLPRLYCKLNKNNISFICVSDNGGKVGWLLGVGER